MTARIVQFRHPPCPACKEVLHDRCWQYLGELLGFDHVPCPCPCRDEDGELTHAALVEMARKQPEALARKIRFDTGFAEHSSLRFHLNQPARKISSP